jgi:hypothetical protein
MQACISDDEQTSHFWSSRCGSHFEQAWPCDAVEAGDFGSAGEGKGYIPNHQESHQTYRARIEHFRLRFCLWVASG